MKAIFLFLLLVLSIQISAQVTISGHVKDTNGNPLPYVNVYIKELLEGGITTDNGSYTFTTKTSGTVVLVVSSIGYQSFSKKLVLGSLDVVVNVVLQEDSSNLEEVEIAAGVFDASDRKKTSILKPLDIVSNPGANGDMYAALETLPGSTPVGNETGLFVRGGEASETKTIIDGSLVSTPFFSNAPDTPSRGKFDPFLFKGTLFSTGGYSAQYGQALSSVLVLNTNDMPRRNSVGIDINMAGFGASFTKIWKERTALMAAANYTNLSSLFAIVPQNRTWSSAPNGFGSSVGFRHQTTNGGMFKSFVQYNYGNIGIEFDQAPPTGAPISFSNDSKNLFLNNSFTGYLNDWKVMLTGAYSYDKDVDRFNSEATVTKDWLAQSRLTMERKFGASKLRVGGEVQMYKNSIQGFKSTRKIQHSLSAFYLESDVKLATKLALRIGFRTEHASLLEKTVLMPRTSLSYRLGKNRLVSVAYGTFNQLPQNNYLRISTALKFEKSSHYIANFQWKKKQQLFRIEAYVKSYSSLLKEGFLGTINNEGNGFSKGIDFFWRDQKSIKNLTYWLSYSYVDSKRLYKDYPIKTTPSFVSNHNLSLVANYKLTPLLRTGISYSYASGKPYFNPNNENFLSDKTIDYHNLNVSASFLTSLFGNFSVLFASLKNPFNMQQIFGYRYSQDGAQRSAIVPSSNWSFFAGVSISLE